MSVLHSLARALLSTTPGVASMRGHPQHRDWAAKLVELGQNDGLEPLRPLLAAIGEDALTTLAPLNRFLKEDAAKLDINVFGRAAGVAEGASRTEPCAAFVLGLVALVGWATALGDAVGAQRGGMPHSGWLRLPYVVARAAFRLGGNLAPLDLVEMASQTLGAAKYLFDERLQAALQDYRSLSGAIRRRAAGAVADLAEELRAATPPSASDFRAEIGAILWTLGYVPESRLLRPEHGDAPVLSRRFYRRVVEQSLAAIPHDPLLQYIWLAMKDRRPVNLREHGEIFERINLRYSETLLDQALPEPPSRVFAASLIAWFRGDIDRAGATAYLEVCGLVAAQFPDCDWLVFLRMQALARLLARHFDLLRPEAAAGGDAPFWHRIAEVAAGLRRTNALHPEWPSLGNRTGIATFQTIDALADAGSDPDAAATLEAVESMREAALVYWLAAVPPLPSAAEQTAIAPLLEEEQKLLVWLRGAYFLVLTPILPAHYRRYGMELGEMLDTERRDRIDPDTGRIQFKEVIGELAALHKRMREQAPDYARRRLHPRPEPADLVRILGVRAAGRA